jgi:hypothetical protein
MSIDALLPTWDRRLWFAEPVRAAPHATFAAIRRVDFFRSPLIGIPNRARVGFDRTFRRAGTTAEPPRHFGFDQLLAEDGGFHLVEEEPGREIVLGFVGRWWERGYGRVEWDPAGFPDLGLSGVGVGAWSFTVLPYGADSVLVSEIRVRCTDDAARRRFARYWMLVGGFVAAMGRPVLRLVRAEAEGSGVPASGRPPSSDDPLR